MVPTPRLTLYHAPMTRSVRVRWCLEEMGLPHTLERVSFDRGDVGGEAYRQVNPLQKVPAFSDGETVILESPAIVQYLVTKYGPTPLAVSQDEPEYGRFLEWLHFGEATMSMGVNLVLAHSMLLPEKHRNPQLLSWARETVDRQLGLIAARGLDGGTRDWLVAGRLTAADMSVGYMLYLLKITKQFDGAPEPVRAYFDRIRALESWQKASKD
ncbi:MAG: glutathione S-transferase family protein [Oceanicaulis sp.]